MSELITDHFHLWEQGSGNYHMGYSGFEFIRGMEADAYLTDPIDVPLPSERYRSHKTERHYRNVARIRCGADGRVDESRWFAPQTFGTAADWLDRNHTRQEFYLHIDSFPPHEPWDPPERLVRMFDPRGYRVGEYFPTPPYAPISESGMTMEQARHVQALYAASVIHVDECLGMVLDALDRWDLWSSTLVILTSDHGTFNGSRGRLGKAHTHLHDPIAHIPLIVAHPTLAHGERRTQLAQLVDLYPTTLSALGIEPCEGRHGVDLLPVLEDVSATPRDFAICGSFGESVTITDGRWVLHQQPVESNQPLHWYSHRLPRFINYDVGPYRCADGASGRRATVHRPNPGETWLSDHATDLNELSNLATSEPGELSRLESALARVLREIGAPVEQLRRLGLERVRVSAASHSPSAGR